MSMGYGLYQEQVQRLLMTQQMRQAITVLQCSAVELDQYVQDEMSDNPLAEVQPVSTQWLLPWTGTRIGSVRSTRARTVRGDRQAPPLEQVVESPQERAAYLEEQIRLNFCADEISEVAVVLIGELDEQGYLREADEELAGWLGVPVCTVTAAVERLQDCEPSGIAARNLQQCLRLQLHRVPEPQRAMVAQVIELGLDDIAAGRLANLARRLRVTTIQLQDAVDALRKLNPRPGLSSWGDRPAYIIPDVVVEQVGDRYVVITNDAAQPSIHMDAAYRRYLAASDPETKQYLAHKVQSIHWLVRCLEQRRMTLHRVAEALISTQGEFFRDGPGALRPLTLRQVAQTLGLHESTISRATRNKYMQTPRGVVEMKYFFSAEIASQSGSHSAQSAKHAIRTLIHAEDAAVPLSDEVIRERLETDGIYLSRRTVAKYREAMGIAPSNRRRRFA